MRKGVTFHNGKTLTADDVIATFNYHRGENTKSSGKALLKAVKDIRKADNHTAVFELESGNADFPICFPEYFFIIFPAKNGELDWKSGAGTGGYKIAEFSQELFMLVNAMPTIGKKGAPTLTGWSSASPQLHGPNHCPRERGGGSDQRRRCKHRAPVEKETWYRGQCDDRDATFYLPHVH